MRNKFLNAGMAVLGLLLGALASCGNTTLTISSYKTRIFEKLGISTLVELVDFTRAHHLVS